MQAIVASSSISTGILSKHLDRSRSRILRSKSKTKTIERANFPSPRGRVTKTKTIELNLQNFTNIIRRVFVNAVQLQVPGLLAETELIYTNHARHAFAPGGNISQEIRLGNFGVFRRIRSWSIWGAPCSHFKNVWLWFSFRTKHPVLRISHQFQQPRFHMCRLSRDDLQEGRPASYASSQTAFEQTKDSRIWCLVPIALNTRLLGCFWCCCIHQQSVQRGKVKYSFLPLRT